MAANMVQLGDMVGEETRILLWTGEEENLLGGVSLGSTPFEK